MLISIIKSFSKNMFHLTYSIIVIIILTVAITLFSCEKEETENQGPDYGPGYIAPDSI